MLRQARIVDAKSAAATIRHELRGPATAFAGGADAGEASYHFGPRGHAPSETAYNPLRAAPDAMKTPALRTSLLMLAVAALVAACGGGDDPADGAVRFAGKMRAASAAAPAAVTAATTVTPAMTLDWAEYKFPDLFPKAIAVKFDDVVYEGVHYTARMYAGAWGVRYLGITPDGRIFGLGDFTNNQLQQFDDIPFWSTQILADQCSVYPGSCGNPPAGPLNECADAAAATLPTGYHVKLIYDFTGSITGEQTVESIIDGPSTFEGQSAIKITSQTSGTSDFQGTPVTINTKIESYEQLAPNDVTRTLGDLSEMHFGTFFSSKTKTVYNPARDNLEFHVALGQTGSITSTSTTTTIEPAGTPPSTTTFTETFSFAAKEPRTVFGRTYETCRYRTEGINANSYTTTWYMLGRGVPVEIETMLNGSVTDRQRLKSGERNGAPL